MRNKIFLFILIFLAIYFSFVIYDNYVAKDSNLEKNLEKSQQTTENILKIGEAEVKFEIADTPFKRITGLSDRENLEPGTGLLFIFEESDFHGFWMKEMNFPIDIIWITPDFSVVHIEKSVDPNTFPQIFRPEAPAKYVLEVESGFSEKNMIKVGSKVVFPLGF